MAEKFWVDDTKGFPCKDCQERHQACWQNCMRYKAAKKAHYCMRREKSKQRNLERAWCSVRKMNSPEYQEEREY